MLNHQCPRLRCRTREPAANLLSICLLSCSSRDLQKLRLLFLFICCRLQRYDFSFTFRHFFENILRTHRKLYVWGFNIYLFPIKNIRKGITLKPQLVAASQLVGNVGFSIILTVFWKFDIKWMGHELLFEFICYQLVYEQRVDYSYSSRINCSFILSVIGNK